LEEDATRKAAIEELKLQELRDSGKAKASQLAQAEDRLVKAQKSLTAAQGKTKTAMQGLEDVQVKTNQELDRAKHSADAAGKSFRTLGQRIKGALSGSGSGAFRGLAAAAGKAGASAGKGFARNFQGSVGTLGAGLSKSVGGLAKAAGVGALAVGALGVAGAGVGIKIAAGMETAKIGFTTMLGSAKKADAFLRDLQKFAAETPFEFPELQTAASSLISAGISAKDVIPIMRTLGDATAGMGTGSEGIQRATVALQQMSAAGRITGEDLNQLRDAGIPVYDLLAKATGKSKAEVVKLAAAGKLGKKELDQLMSSLKSGQGLERFNGLMEKTSKSLSGMFSTLKDTLGQGLANAITPAFPLIKSGLTAVSTALGRVFKFVADNKDSFSDLFSTIGHTLEAVGKVAKGAFAPFIQSLTGGKATFKSFADFISTHQADIVGGFVKLASGAVEFGIGLAKTLAVGLRGFATFADVVETMTQTVIDSFYLILTATANTFSWIPGLGPKLKAAQSKFGEFAKHARDGMGETGKSARGAADAIDGKLVPALEDARDGLKKVGAEEGVKAELRDNAATAAIAIKKLGTAADGSQIKLKTFAQWSKLGSAGQHALAGRVVEAKRALVDQYKGIVKANGGQKALAKSSDKSKVAQGQLTKAWEKGKDRLYKEFKQMGLSNKAARDLAKRYAGIKPKVQTKFTQPGMAAAKKDTLTLATRINGIKGRKVDIHFTTNASTVSKTLKNLSTGGPVPKVPQPVDPRSFADGGEIVGKGGPRQDNIAGIDKKTGVQTAWVSAKEFVVNAKAYAQNRRLIHAINRGQKIRPVGLAGGGVVETKFASVPKSAMELGDKFDRFSSVNSGRYGRLFGNAAQKALQKRLDGAGVKGGGYAAALAYAKRHEGHPYVFGSLWDCSGFISSLHSIIKGQKPHRMYSTPAFHGPSAQGFTRGKKSAFMVGVNPAPGKFGHMAGTLNKQNVESSGGVGVRVGGGARGWNNGMFSWRGGLAVGGVVPQRLRRVGDLPYDTLSPRGQRYDPQLARLFANLEARPLADGGPVIGQEANLTRRQLEKASAGGTSRTQYGDIYTVSAKQLWAEERAEEQRHAALHRRW
jgi:tape measure domain-containing protein